MYFAWLGFYTTSMLYPAVIGFVLWMLTESDQVGGTNAATAEIRFGHGGSEASAFACAVSDEPRHLLRGVRSLQRGVGHTLPGAVEEEGSGAGVQVGYPGHARRIPGGAPATI